MLKTCTSCGIIKEFNEFHHLRRSKDGYNNRCKQCLSEKEGWNYKAPIRNGMKQCRKCKQYFPATLEYFHKHGSGVAGLNPKCKSCIAEKSKIYRSKNKDKIYIQIRDWQKKNPEKCKARTKRFKDKNPEKVAEAQRKYDLMHIDKVRIKRKKASTKWRQKFLDAEGYFTHDDIIALLISQDGRCSYCGITLYDLYTIDHIMPLSRGGSNWPDNLALACDHCNKSKHDRTIEEWMAARSW